MSKATRQSPSYCHSEGFMPEESLLDLLTTLLICHSERGQSPTEESLNESLVANRDSSPLAGVQNDKLSYPQGKLFCHSELSQESEESLSDLPATPLLCHSEGARSGGEESLFDIPEILQVCHSEGFMPEESLPESLVAKRDSSPLAGVQNDNESNPQDKITLQGKLFCHSELSQESEESLLSTKDSLNESLESPQRFFGAEAQRHDKLTAFTKNPNSNSSLLSQARAKKLNNIRVKSRNSHKAKNPT